MNDFSAIASEEAQAIQRRVQESTDKTMKIKIGMSSTVIM
jgi:hypothetical protein